MVNLIIRDGIIFETQHIEPKWATKFPGAQIPGMDGELSSNFLLE